MAIIVKPEVLASIYIDWENVKNGLKVSDKVTIQRPESF